jgi:dipeptidyl aminopeptidase/acylaminoacyl peptidase
LAEKPWLGVDEHGGVPSQKRPDRDPPPHWRLDAIWATEIPTLPAVSPDGSLVAFVLAAGPVNDIYILPATGGQARRLTTDRPTVNYWADSAPAWSPDGTRIAYQRGDDVAVIPVAGGPPKAIPDVSLGAWLDEERMIVVVERDRTTRLAIVEVSEPWPRVFGPAGGDVTDVMVGDGGRVVATFWPKEDWNRSDIVVAQPDGEWQILVGFPDRRALDHAVDGGRVAYCVEEGDWRAVYLTDLDGTDQKLLAKDDADFGSLAWSRDGKKLAATKSRGGQSDLVIIEPDGIVTVLAEGGSWQVPQWSNEGVVAVHEANDTAPRLMTFADRPVVLYDGAPTSVTAAPHVPFERVRFPSGDGLEIEGFLFRPANGVEPVPAVVYPHGGPTDAYGDVWDGHAQYFLDKGYAWLAINFRGSTGYGVGFERANHNDWGVGDTADCIAAGRYLAGLDWVDGDRLAIFGASYGSYMAVTSLVHPENPFACGVAKYGDCNILTSWAQGDRPGREDLERMMGHPSTNREAYRAGSPIHQIERLDRPILIAHGEKDDRVHVEQSRELVAALQRLGKTYEYVTYPGEAHGFLGRETQIDFYRRLERFLDWYLL